MAAERKRPAQRLPDHEVEKRLAAEKSLEYVEDGMVLGLGTGSTAEQMIRLLGERVRRGLKVRAVPTSERTRRAAEMVGIPLTTLDDCPKIDLTIDGADEVSPALDLIKGGGGALLREKVAAAVSGRLVIVVDSRKMVPRLGAFPLPVEVSVFAWRPVKESIAALGIAPVLRRGEGGIPFRTDGGGYIMDCAFGAIDDPATLAAQLDAIPGVLEHGLFVGMADVVLVGRRRSVEVLTRQER
ncbi:MAG: ribose-5-phosphate isomerase RpiA [Rhodospirillaceae bacterium]